MKQLDIHTVGYAGEDQYEKAKGLADKLGFLLSKDASLCLYVDDSGLALKIPGYTSLQVSFAKEHWVKRKNEGKNQGIVQACKPQKGMRILDATAGWGRDAAVLAMFGAEVVLCERHHIMSELLHDALNRMDEASKHSMSLNLIPMDARTYLQNVPDEDYPDVIYIDPMHPEREKSALVKKDLYLLQQLIGPDVDAWQLIELARLKVKQKVVVKWPQKGKPLIEPNYKIKGKTVCFLVYQNV